MPFDKNVAGPLTRLLFVSRPQTIPTLSLSDALFLLGCHRLRRRDRAYEPQPCPRCARASVISGFDLRRRAKEVAAAFKNLRRSACADAADGYRRTSAL